MNADRPRQQDSLESSIRRAAHQLIDQPRVLDDPIAVRLIGTGFPATWNAPCTR
ncbi:MAG TPA: hypothetical protein VGT08_20385 [Terracidiphilus sp.]|nr:hypothetical protein [Terracidiphilus sp.]